MSGAARTIDPERLLAHEGFVRAVARALLRDVHAADDVVQETWVAALRGGPDRGSLRGWLGGVARNLALVRRRTDRRTVAREALAARPEGVPSDVEILERERLRRRVVAAVLALEEPYRATLLLRYFEGLPPREVALRMEVPVETVRTRTRRGIALVRSALGAPGAGDERRAEGLAVLAMTALPREGAASTTTGGGLLMATGVKVAVVLVAAAAVGWALWPSGESEDAPSRDVAKAPAPPDPPRAARPTAPAPAPALVAGRVVDEAGTVVVGAEVRVADSSARTDAEGRFSVTVTAPGRVPVALSPDPSFDVPESAPRDTVAPSEDVRIVVRRHPTATVEVVLSDLDAGEPVAAFTADVHAGDAPPVRLVADSGTARGRIRLPRATDCPVRAVLVEPAPPQVVEAKGRASDGDDVRIALALRRSDTVRGRVVGPDGSPVAGALVFLGSHLRARGDEPAKPFRPERVKDGVRTGSDGRYELRGVGTVVTAWHEGHSATTVRLADAWRLSLPARGSLRGRVLDANGAAVADVRVQIGAERPKNPSTSLRTDADGRYAFDDVEAGFEVLVWGEGRVTAVRVRPGAPTEADLLPGLAEVRIPWPGPGDPPQDAFLIGAGDIAPFVQLSVQGTDLVGRGAVQGTYHFLARGVFARVTVEATGAKIERGTGTLVVRTPAGIPVNSRLRVFARPADAGLFVDRLAARAVSVKPGEDGVVRFENLLPGRWAVGTDRGSDDDELRVVVTVGEGTTEATLD